MKKINNIKEQINRMKSLFTEERMFGNLVEQEDIETKEQEFEGIEVTGDKPETNQNTDTSEETESIESEVEMDKLDKKGCIKHIKDMHKKINSSGDRIKWKSDNPESVKTIESCLKTHYETFQKQGIFKAGDEAKHLINLLELKIDKPKDTKDKNIIEIKNNRGNVVLYIKLIKGNLYRFRGKKGQVIIDSARSGGLGKVKYFNPDIEKNIMDQMKLTGKKITINKGINTKGLDMGTFTVN